MTMALRKQPLSTRVDPEAAYAKLLAHEPWSVWSDDHGERGSGVSYLATLTPIEATETDFPAASRAAHHRLRVDQALPRGVPLGVLLVLPYEYARHTLGLGLLGDQTPIAAVIDRLIAIEHASGSAICYGMVESDDDWAAWVAEVDAALARAEKPAAPVLPQGLPCSWRDEPPRYLEVIAHAQEAIRRGDAYQLCLTTQVSIEGDVDPVGLHRVLRTTNPTHHQALLRLGELSIVSASPETFLDISADHVVRTRPIKGTRPRGATPERDLELARELLASDKERAENLMIVDLMRNDLSRVCEVGSVDVPELLVVESYASVHQLVSTVRGTLREGFDLLDVLGATFPAGSMTGAPKRRAVELLASWESGPRGYYSGTYGLWRADGSATMAMTIRSAVIEGGVLSLGVGGGITALSEPQAEIEEVGVKALPVLRALGISDTQYS